MGGGEDGGGETGVVRGVHERVEGEVGQEEKGERTRWQSSSQTPLKKQEIML